jgi:hypothetical protein
MIKLRTALGVVATTMGVVMMAGCGALQMQDSGFQPGGQIEGAALHGVVFGGNQPSTGAVIQLYQVGVTGYGSAAKPLLTKTVTTGTGGFFSITGDYSCSAGTYVYITATGGNPGFGAGTVTNGGKPVSTINNADSAMMVALGDCGNLTSSSTIWINEVTTVAAVWALQQFIAIVPGTTLYAQPGTNPVTTGQPPAFSIGTSAGNMQGLKNAFQVAAILATTNTGVSPGAFGAAYTGPGTAANRVLAVENWQVNTIADVLSACVNTDTNSGDSAYSSTCSTMAGYVTPSGATPPSDTLQIAYDMAQNPTLNVSNLFAFVPGTGAPFQPIAGAVSDWTIAYNVNYNYDPSGTANYYTVLNTGVSIAFDSFGNAWIMNTAHDYTSPSLLPFLTELDGTGNYVTQYTSYNMGTTTSPVPTTFSQASPFSYSSQLQVSIDPSNNVYVPDYGNGNLVRVGAASAAAAAGGTAFGMSLGTGSVPNITASDANGNIYVALGGSTAATTIPTANAKGLAVVVPNLPAGGPLTAGAGSSIQTTLGAGYKAIAVTQNSSSTYGGGGFLYLSNTSNPCSTTSGYGTSMQGYFTNAATVSGAASNTTITTGQPFPYSAIVNENTSTSCGSAYVQVPNVTQNYAGTDYTVPAFDTIGGLGIDSGDNIWTVSVNGSVTVAGFPEYWVTQLAPTYFANPGTGSLLLSYNPTIFTAPILLGTSVATGGTAPATTFAASTYLVIDGGNNAWIESAGSNGTVTAVNATAGVLSNQNPIVATSGGSTWTCAGFCGSVYFSNFGGRRDSGATGSGLAVDLSGNVWKIFVGSGSDNIQILVGAAVPPVLPLSLAAKNHAYGTRP